MRKLCQLLILFTGLSMIFSCSDNNKGSETDSLFKFKDYILHNTSGRTSIAQPITVSLAKSLTQYELTQEIPSEYLKISPKTKGKLFVENGNTLVFQPTSYLKPDTEYSITVSLKSLYEDIAKAFNSYTFSFKTIATNFKINLGSLQSYSKELQYLTGTLEASDILKASLVKKIVNVSQNGKSITVKWPQNGKDSKYFYFTIDSIQREIDDSFLDIRWDGTSVGSENKGENKFRIPGRNNFTVVDMKTAFAPKAFLTLNFSDPLLKNQNFKGLVNIENTKNLSFEVEGNLLHVYPSSKIVGTVRVNVFQGIKNTEGYKLKQEFSEQVAFEQLKPALKLLSKGVILPNAHSTPFYFEAVNLKAVDVRIIKIYEDNLLQFLQNSNLNGNNSHNIRRVGRRIAKKTIALDNGNSGQWKAYGVNLSELFQSSPGALYRIELSFRKEYASYNCANSGVQLDEVEDEEYYSSNSYSTESSTDEDDREAQYWDNRIYSWRHYNYNWKEQDNPCHDAYYNEGRIISTNILGSDLGIIVKKGSNKTYHFATTNLLTANIEPHVKISLYNYQQQLIDVISTDAEGRTIYDSNQNAAFAVAVKGRHYAYVKLGDGNALSLSKFDVSGKKLQKGMKGFLYTERGVHRPGDSIHLSFVLNDIANTLPKAHPVKLEVIDAKGKLVHRRVQNQGNPPAGRAGNNFYYFPISTLHNAPTGNWRATISVGGASFTKTLRIATVKPNRLKIKLDFDDAVLSTVKPITANANISWLHGAPGRNLKLEMTATIRNTTTAFKKFPKYVFNDPVRHFDEIEIPIINAKVDEQGNIKISKKLDLGNHAPGMLRASFLSKAFEGGGDFSIDVFSKNIAPFTHFVGMRSPKGRAYGSYFTGENTVFDVATVNAEGKPRANRELEIKVFKIEWRWWWSRGRDNLSRYENASVHRPVKAFTIKTNANGKNSFTLNFPEEERGRYLIRVIDKKSGHATGRVAYFYRNWWQSPNGGDTESAKMLVFSSDKESYQSGEEAVISFPSGSEGRALLSVENGTEVLETHWIKTQKGETKFRLPIGRDFAPNVFVNIALLQPHEQTKNNLPIRLYGVIPLLVEDPATILSPKIEMAKVIKPEEKYSITISEENKKPMTYTLAVVDDGLLDLTRFKTPEIHKAFYTREALGVKTFDIYDYVIGTYSGSVDNIYEIGGGDEAAGAKNKKANRFKPVVQFLGPFYLEPGKKAVHQLTMPNYVGSVRTMLIAGDHKKAAYGKAENTTPVRKPLMVLASIPRKLSPGETVTLPVTVFAMEKNIKKVSVMVKLSDGLSPKNGSSKIIAFNAIGEQIVNFEFDVLPRPGIQTIEVIASGHGEKASYKVALDVENPNPITQKVSDYTVDKNQEINIDFSTYGVSGTNTAIIEVSTLPPMDFTKRMQYLIRYPHGCVEQITSAVFPQLFLADIFDINFNKKKQAEKNIKAAIAKLANFQNSSGGLSYWQGERNSNAWGTNYAGHFMIEAKQKGFVLPLMFMNNWLRFQQNKARQWQGKNHPYNSSLTQAYRLYTLALARQPELAAMNRLRESANLSNEAKWRLAGAYALAGQHKVALEISSTANLNFQGGRYNYYTYGSPFRNKAMALETIVVLNNEQQKELAISLAKKLSSKSWLSTQETAFALLAMAKMVTKNGGKALNLTLTHQGKPETIATAKAIAQSELGIRMGQNTFSLKNNNNNVVFVRLMQEGKLPLGSELAQERNLKVKTIFYDNDGKNIPVANLRQGTEIIAKINVFNSSDDYIDNVALTQIFPSGWEIINTSFTELAGGASGNARYKDIRDDRVNFYFDLGAKKSRTFTVKLNTSYLGKYYLPGTQTEAMYDANYYARNKGRWVEVKR